jgi:ribosomal protein S18 acetylase RimI-like enzyme
MVLEYLARNEIETSFLYANVVEFGLDNDPDIRRCGDYYGYFEGEALKGILPLYNLGSCIPHYEADVAIPLFADIMKESRFEFLLGMQRLIMPLYEEVKNHKETEAFNESSYFVNKDFKAFTLEGVKFHNANGTFSEETADFILQSRVKGFNQNVTIEEVRTTLVQRGEEEAYLVMERDGKMVAAANIQTYTPQIGQIGAVYTAEEERGKGNAKAIVSEMCRRIIAKGKVPTLTVKKNNTPALRAYTALGFKHYDDYLIIRFR